MNPNELLNIILNSPPPENYNLEKHLIKKAHPEFTDAEVNAYILGFEECAETVRNYMEENDI